ncbi:MAG: IS200/IS605 family transposase [Verrucomicrobiaceae bacterium]|nr:MAG: IS200/IS605 family transposase [Verrucomicrobiaceae bacterium]
MSSTHLSLHYHVVFGTKGRVAMIAPEWRERLHAYMGGVLRDLGGIPESIGGMADHVHILAGLKASHRLSDILRDLKRGSSEWVHTSVGIRQFAWQEGYGAFTVSASRREMVRQYIAQQEEHHRVRTFREEYIEFLQRHGVPFEERFLD